MAYLQLLGAPRARVGDTWHDLPASKPALLLVYLACRGTWLDRSELAHAVRPEASEATARHNLRLLLHRARKLPWAEGVEVEAQRIRWLVDSDVREFREAVERRDWGAAAEMPAVDFLPGMGLADMPELQAWIEREREELQAAWSQAVSQHAARLMADERHAQAAALLERGMRQDPLSEEMLQAYLRAVYLDGQRDKALEAYGAFEARLADELELEPLEETQSLVEAIRASEPLGPEAEASAGAKRPIRFDNLPSPPTDLVGREQELTRLDEMLSAQSRLLTLIGPGGIGKTRLAVEAAARRAGAYQHGVCLVPLAPLPSGEHLVQAIAEALGLSFYGRRDPEQQLLDYLREKEMLLLLDNFEHCMDAVDLVARIQAHAPRVRVLATSRQRLDLRGESLFAVDSLPYPPADAALGDDAQAYPAVRLFLEGARRIDPDFDPQDAKAVGEVCRLVEGMPLAIELAASWAHVIPAAEIAEELRGGLAFLEASAHDLPERHRSMSAVFDYSWGLLSDEERRALRRLSVFRGGFTRAAAAAVAGADLPMLAALLNKSFLRRNRSGRYEIHELLRQYAEARPGKDLREVERARAAHGRHFCTFLREREAALGGAAQKQALEAIREDAENVRAAWRWAVAALDVEALDGASRGLARYVTMRSLHREGLEAFGSALARLDDEREGAGGPLRTRLRGRLSWLLADCHVRLGEHRDAKRLLERALATLEPLADAEDDAAHARRGLALVARWQGDYEEAEALLRRSLEIFRAHGDRGGCAQVLRSLAIGAKDQGDLTGAKGLLEEAIALAREVGDAWLAADALIDYGNAEKAMGRNAEAKRLYDESLAIKRELGHQYGVAANLVNLGVVAEALGDYGEAERDYRRAFEVFQEIGFRRGMALSLYNQAMVLYLSERSGEARAGFEEALAMYREVGEKRGICAARHGMGLAALALGETDAAEGHFHESLVLARDLGYLRGVSEGLTGLGKVALATGADPQARERFLEALATAKEGGLGPLMLDAILGLGRVSSRDGDPTTAVRLLTLARDHPASERSARDEAERALSEASAALPEEGPAATPATDGARLDHVAEELLAAR